MTSCSDNGFVENSTAVPISVAQAKAWHGHAGVEFVDPRPVEVIAATTGRIPGARLVSIEDMEKGRLPFVFTDRSIRVVVTCHAGPMASRAAAVFTKLGFAHVNWIQGGTRAWIDAGHPAIC